MKHLQVCLSATKDGECSFHHSGSLVKLVQSVRGKIEKAVFITVAVLSNSCKPV